MSTIVTDSKNYTAIADKIRKRTGGAASYYPTEMPSGIRAVYENGKQSFGLLETVNGAGAVRADYVNPTEHPVNVTVASKNQLQFEDIISSVTYGLSATIEKGVATITATVGEKSATCA